MPGTEPDTRGKPAGLTAHTCQNGKQKTGSEGTLLQGFSGLPPQVDATLLVDSPKISIENYSDSSVLKKRTHVGHKF